MSDDEISEQGRKARFEQWEKLSLDRVKHDLLNVRLPDRRRDAPSAGTRMGVRIKEAELAEAKKKPQ